MKKRIFAAAVLGIFLLLFLINWFYQSIHSKQNTDQQQAIETALAKTGLVSADHVDSYIGEKPYMVVSGMDKDGRKLFVWVNKDEVDSEYSLDGINKQQVEVKVLRREPRAELIRIIPGKLEDDFIWEAFYKKKEGDGTRYFYSYYNFTDGTLIDTYRLSKLK